MFDRVSVEGLSRAGGIFAVDPRFLGGGMVLAEPNVSAPVVLPEHASDPVEDAYAAGWAEGHAAAAAEAEARSSADAAALEPLRIACARLDAEQTEALGLALRETVLALCADVLEQAALVPEGLESRARAAAAMLARADDDRVIRLHPDDLALIGARLPAEWAVLPDPALSRGSLRVDGNHGGVEDGPVQWHAALAEALRRC